MAACLRSLRLGVTPLVPGGAGGGRHLGGRTRRTGVQSGSLQSSSSVAAAAAALHLPTTPSPHHQPGEGWGWGGKTVLPLHCFDPVLGQTLCPATHTLDDIEVKCSSNNNNNNNNNILTFRLPMERKRGDGAPLSPLPLTPIEREASETTLPHKPLGENYGEGEKNGWRENFGMRENYGWRENYGVGEKNGGGEKMGVLVRSMGLGNGEVEMMYCSSSSPSSSSPSSPSSSPSSSSSSSNLGGKPDAEKLSYVFNMLADSLPKLFTHPMDYTIYSQNIVFDDRIRGVRTVGLFPYVRQVALLRTVGHFRFAFVRFEILKITKHPEEGSVKVRWRIKGLSGVKAIVRFWKIRLWNWKSVEDQMVTWYEGFSTFYVGQNGLVHTHIADTMMPDEELQLADKSPLAVKMAAMLGLVHRPNSGSSLNSTNTTTTRNTTTTTTRNTTTSTTTAALLQEEKDRFVGLVLPLEEVY